MSDKKSQVSKKATPRMTAKNFGFQVVGQSFSEISGKVEITKETYYTLQQYTEPSSYKEKIIHWIGKNGIYLERNGETLEDDKLTAEVADIFKDNTWLTFKDKYFTNHFCSGDIYLYTREDVLGGKHCQVVDSRTVMKTVNKFGDIVGFVQFAGGDRRALGIDQLYNSIVRFNPQRPAYGRSLYEGILYDAMSDTESSKRQFYFFKNSGVPNALFMLDPSIRDKDVRKEIREEIKSKFQGSENAHKFMVSGGIQDVKILEMSNRDLDLLGLRNFVTKKWGMVFHLDPRIIGFMSDSGADRSITAIRQEANETISNLSRQFEDDLNNFYKGYINPKADFIIRVNSEQFTDRDAIEEAQRKDVQLGLITINEVRKERELDEFTEQEANKPLIGSNLSFLDQLANQFTP